MFAESTADDATAFSEVRIVTLTERDGLDQWTGTATDKTFPE